MMMTILNVLFDYVVSLMQKYSAVTTSYLCFIRCSAMCYHLLIRINELFALQRMHAVMSKQIYCRNSNHKYYKVNLCFRKTYNCNEEHTYELHKLRHEEHSACAKTALKISLTTMKLSFLSRN